MASPNEWLRLRAESTHLHTQSLSHMSRITSLEENIRFLHSQRISHTQQIASLEENARFVENQKRRVEKYLCNRMREANRLRERVIEEQRRQRDIVEFLLGGWEEVERGGRVQGGRGTLRIESRGGEGVGEEDEARKVEGEVEEEREGEQEQEDEEEREQRRDGRRRVQSLPIGDLMLSERFST